MYSLVTWFHQVIQMMGRWITCDIMVKPWFLTWERSLKWIREPYAVNIAKCRNLLTPASYHPRSFSFAAEINWLTLKCVEISSVCPVLAHSPPTSMLCNIREAEYTMDGNKATITYQGDSSMLVTFCWCLSDILIFCKLLDPEISGKKKKFMWIQWITIELHISETWRH